MRFGNYEAVSEIGRGGMGVVYRARDARGNDVAVKVVTARHDAEANAGFERERRLLATLSDVEGFVPIVDAGVTDSHAWVAMPLLTGSTLRARLAKGPMKVPDAVALVRQLARAMGKAHARGIVHRDLKPENVLFTHDGRPLVADLGLAKHFRRDVAGASRSEAISSTGIMAGTLGYMPPEQIDDAKGAGPPADVFALGVLLHECLTGWKPFPASGFVSYAESLRRGAPRIDPDVAVVPDWLEAALRRALAYESDRRFPDGESFAAALEGPPTRGRRRVAAVAFALVALGVAALAELAASGHEVPPPPGRAVEPRASSAFARGARLLETDDFPGAIAAFSEAIAEEPSSSAPWAERAWARAFDGILHGGTEVRLLALADAEHAVALDPRSTRALCSLAFAHADQARLDLVLEDVARALALDPRCTRAFLWRGFVLARRNDDDSHRQARIDLDRALALEPAGPDAWLVHGNLSGLATITSDKVTAIAEARLAYELGAPHPFAAVMLAGALNDEDHAAEAAHYAAEAVRRDPLNAGAWSLRVDTRSKAGLLREEIDDDTRWLEHDPRFAQALVNRGFAKLRSGDPAGARRDFDAARALPIDNAATRGALTIGLDLVGKD